MIKELFAEGKTEAEIKTIMVTHLGMNEIDAQMAIDLELGRGSAGDDLRVRADGSERAARSVILLPKDMNP